MVYEDRNQQRCLPSSTKEGLEIYVSTDESYGRQSKRNVSIHLLFPIRIAQPREKVAIEMQLGELQIKFNECPNMEYLKVVLGVLMGASKPIC